MLAVLDVSHSEVSVCMDVSGVDLDCSPKFHDGLGQASQFQEHLSIAAMHIGVSRHELAREAIRGRGFFEHALPMVTRREAEVDLTLTGLAGDGGGQERAGAGVLSGEMRFDTALKGGGIQTRIGVDRFPHRLNARFMIASIIEKEALFESSVDKFWVDLQSRLNLRFPKVDSAQMRIDSCESDMEVRVPRRDIDRLNQVRGRIFEVAPHRHRAAKLSVAFANVELGKASHLVIRAFEA